MSIADLRPSRALRGERGYTVIEALITVVILALITLVIQQTVSGVNETERTMRAVRTTTREGHEACYRIRDLVATSRKLYGNDALGTGYLGKLALGTAPQLAGGRLPTFDEVNPLGPDAVGDPHTGNVLLFVREAAAVPCVADAPTKKTRLVDTYRIVCVYLTATARTLVAGGPVALDLVEWRSHGYPSYAQVTGIVSATEKTKVVKDLYNRYGFDYLWDPTQPVATAFYAIDTNGVIAATATNVASIPEDRNVSKGGRFVVGNVGVARTDLTSKPRTPIFTADDPAVWTPHGFEVKVVGASGSRKVWLRLTVEQQAAHGRVPCMQTTVVANTRDL